MIIRDKAIINAPASVIWEFLKDPSMMIYWNPKCIACQTSDHEAKVGMTFTVTYRMSSREQQITCTVLVCEPERQLTIQHSGLIDMPSAYVDETFFLEPISDERTRVRHHVDMTHSGMPWFIRVLFKVIQTIGTKHGKSSLDALAELVDDLGK